MVTMAECRTNSLGRQSCSSPDKFNCIASYFYDPPSCLVGHLPSFSYDTDTASFPYYSAGLHQPIKITVIKWKVLIAPFIIISGHIRQLIYLPGNSLQASQEFLD